VRLTADTFVSQVHARVSERDGTLWVEDVGSTNGTFVNEKRIDNPVKLKRGDLVRVGETVLQAER
jgi:pSer/pThr/pTyr-binding forkhead associated (FHA) protein